jgi:imidazole glycerol-phosphate synthase subunit HisH
MKYDLAIIDYNMGNLFGLECALNYVKLKTIITSDKNTIMDSKAIILPGVGSFGRAMKNIKEKKLDIIIKKCNDEKKIIIGVCLGMQLLFQKSYENNLNEGLSILKGSIVAINDKKKYLNVGWAKNKCKDEKDSLQKLINKKEAYFIHSYVAKPFDKKIILAESTFDNKFFCSAVKSGNIVGFQFHPEKSGVNGIKILKLLSKKIKNNENIL